MAAFSDLIAFLSGAPALVGLLLAALVIFLTASWRLTLLALGAQYVLAGLVLSRTGRLEVALLKALVGALAVVILYLSARRHPVNRAAEAEEDSASPRPTLRPGWLQGSLGLPLRLLAALLAILAAVRVFSHYQLAIAPLDVALIAFWLGALGLLGLVLSGDPLRQAAAVLTILAGFDVVYSSLERSLAMVGLLSAFYLTVALAYAYLTTVHGLARSQTGAEGADS